MRALSPSISVPLADKLEGLRRRVRDMGSVLVCYSGGIDSAFLLAVATAELGERAIGMTAVSPSLSPGEREDASRIAESIRASHRFVESNELDRPGYVANGPDRCFHCKSELYDIARDKQREWGLAFVANGTNLDNLGDHRPGLEAARLAGARSPLVDAGFPKPTFEPRLRAWVSTRGTSPPRRASRAASRTALP